MCRARMGGGVDTGGTFAVGRGSAATDSRLGRFSPWLSKRVSCLYTHVGTLHRCSVAHFHQLQVSHRGWNIGKDPHRGYKGTGALYGR